MSKIFSNLLDDDIEFLPLVAIDDPEGPDEDSLPKEIPILPLRNSILFPGVVIPITVGRDKSIVAVKEALKKSKFIGVVSQKKPDIEDPEFKDIYKVGTVAKIIKSLKMPDGNTTVIIQGKERMKVKKFTSTDPAIMAQIKLLSSDKSEPTPELQALVSTIKDLALQIIEASPNIPNEASIVLRNIENPAFLTHFIASNLNVDVEVKQELLEIDDIYQKADKVLEYLHKEYQLVELKNKIHTRVKGDLDKQQRDYFLNQQLKTIQDELGGNSQRQEIDNLKKKAKTKKWSKKVQESFDKEITRLERTNSALGEYGILLTYLETLTDLPWNEYTEDNFDLQRAKKVLDQDHYGLDKIKERILEYLAVLKLKGDMKSPILCLVGPPGVGKTSLGTSIAKAIDRKYVRMSLGGLHDESEIRGHRKTYIGAMPGRIIQSIKKSQSSNPVFILDEIDKVGKDFRGDPSSALLEVLDPEQNHSFYDNYLEQEYDLSKVMFIATANNLHSVQPALLDRMEIIHLSGYSQEEKVQIAKRHLVPKQRENHGLLSKQARLTNKGIEAIIKNYTREAGVRDLDRKIASIMRSVAKSVVMEEEYKVSIGPEEVEGILGKKRFDSEIYKEKNPAGVAIGLAWTSVGGEILFIETSLNKSAKSQLVLTGNLGDVMKESATTALSYLKAHADSLNINGEDFEKTQIHLHIPEGAIPKDGPSAGITMLTAIASAFTNRRVKSRLAMTGEITLRGKVLPVGGIKDKILAAKRSGMKTIILCELNRKDVEEINADFIKGLKFIYVNKVAEVLEHALV